MKRQSQRIAGVDLPIIPTIAALVRDNPGTISLGQGVVSYGPPDDALAALPARMREAGLHKYQAVSGYPPLVAALAAKLRAENGVETAGASEGSAGPPQASFTPTGGGLGEARPWGRSER